MIFPFNHFNFGKEYKWSLAFYKLCALWHIVHDTDFDNVAWLDSDVYVQLPFNNIWKECAANVLLYDICEGVTEKGFRVEAGRFTGTEPLNWVHYGGEFFAANHDNAAKFILRCEEVFKEMNNRQVVVKSGDEFITSVAAQTCNISVHNAGAYVCRYWTRRFRLVSNNYRFDPVCVLHVPAEKETGMLHVFDRYVCHGRLPGQHAVWRMLHLSRWPIEIWLYWHIKDLLK